MLALFIDDFENNNGMSLSTTSANDARDFSRMYRFDLFTIPNSIYVIRIPKRDFLLIFTTKIVNILSHSFPHTVLLAQSNKAELHVSDVKFLSSFGLSKSLW